MKKVEDPDASELPLLIIGKIRVLDREMQRYSVAVEKQLGIKATDLWFLQVVCLEPGLCLTKVADKLSLMQASASNILSRLIKQGYVSKSQRDADKRSAQLYITESAKELLGRSSTETRCPLRKAMGKWDVDDLRQLHNELQRLVSEAAEIGGTADLSGFL